VRRGCDAPGRERAAARRASLVNRAFSRGR
jgi:hypothetical protein